MNIVTLDFETYFDDQYTLKRLTTEEYIRDPRFETIGVGIRYAGTELIWYGGTRNEISYYLKQIDWSQTACLCHHAHFDGLILSHHFGTKPHAWLDTLSMARLLLGNHLSVSLDSLAKHFGLNAKSVPYDLFRGKHWADLQPDIRDAVGRGCLHDIELTWDIFCRLAQSFPKEEYAVVDMTVRMFTKPTLRADVQMLGQVWTDEARRKAALLASLQLDPAELQSSGKFAELLRASGVEPETKAGKNGDIYAFAKTDEFMKGLLEHEDDRVRTLAEARLGVRSTIDQTRAERLGFMAARGPMPVYLSYAGAHTTRWSGGDKVNWQNFKRGGGIRKAIQAPEGHVIIKADKSQVECRFLNYLAGQDDVIEKFRNGEDPYVGIASKFYQRTITKDDPAERGVGKQLELSCGYGAGADTIRRTAARGTYGPPVELTDDEALAARDLYRSTHPGVTSYWKLAEDALGRMAAGFSFTWSKFHFHDYKVWLPNGCPLIYEGLHWETQARDALNNPIEPHWRFKTRKGWKKIWGGFFTENLIQAISRVDMSQTMLRLRALGYRIVLTEHDALAIVVPLDRAENDMQVVLREMQRAPEWLPDIPLGAEGSYGERYS